MIDKIKISKEIKLDTSKFSEKMYHQKTDDAVNMETGEIYSIDCYKYKINNNISIIYSNITNKLTIEGRLITMNYINNKIYNFDDYLKPRFKEEFRDLGTRKNSIDYMSENSWYDWNDNLCFPPEEEDLGYESEVFENHSIEEIISSLNTEINTLLGTREVLESKVETIKLGDAFYEVRNPKYRENLDIRNFKVLNIEICFNIWLKSDYVREYITMFNLIFQGKDSKRYINFTLEQNVDISTSYYVKPAGQYRDNIKTNYVMNFYDKYNHLESLVEKGNKITTDEFERAKGLLRLEVQLYYIAIKDICNKNKLENRLDNFLDMDLCLDILKDKYNSFIGDYRLDFYSYQRAKTKIENTKMLNANNKVNLLNHIRERHQHNKKHSTITITKYNKMLHRLRIHDYFIPTKFDIDYMKSPIRLLNQKLNNYKKINKKYRNNTLRVISDGEFYSI